MRSFFCLALLGLTGTLTSSGCGDKASATGPAGEAKQIWDTRCANCHGPEGAGDGPAGKALDPPPRSFKDPVWQTKTTDEQIETIILQGGAAVGKNPLMAPNPDLRGREDVMAELVKIVRGFR